tara:strand:- start:45352 stop:45549 length:198 start_codon:yes stop_codon:yes gene_type:complete
MRQDKMLFQALELPCGAVLKNRIAKSAMSDSVGDGTGHPTTERAVPTMGRRWGGDIDYWQGAGDI